MKPLSEIAETEKIPTNSPIDEILGGGVEKGTITQFYGPPGSGKTNIAIKLAVEVAKRGKKVIFIDTEGGLSIERVKQIAGDNFNKVAPNILIYEPSSFYEQGIVIQKINSLLKKEGKKFDAIILDSAVALYRLKEGNSSKLNVELGKQMALLLRIARKYNLAVVITNHIYSLFDEDVLI